MPCFFCKKDGHPELEGIPYDINTMARPCWLYANDERYGALGDGQPIHPLAGKEVYPNTLEQAANLALATTEWIKAGRPTRSDEECQRLHKICEECPEFIADTDRCRKCGCGLSASSSVSWTRWVGIPDGIRQATHHCPLNKW